MNDAFKPGDEVEWRASQGKVRGVVKRKLTRRTRIGRHQVAASPDQPQYLVESEQTHAVAAHQPTALKKRR